LYLPRVVIKETYHVLHGPVTRCKELVKRLPQQVLYVWALPHYM